MIENVTIIGTGLIGTSVGLALQAAGFTGSITGWDKDPEEAGIALDRGALTRVTKHPENAAAESGVVVLATPVLGILHWMERLAPVLRGGQLITDVGSTKLEIVNAGRRLYPAERPEGTSRGLEFLGGHPMAGKERGGAALAEATLFRGAMWLFTPASQTEPATPLTEEWRTWVKAFGAQCMDLEASRHDEVCAWVSHLPQMVATALASMLEDKLEGAPELAEALMQVGGRALGEMTRLGASPFSMWRDVAHTNAEPIGASLQALEQKLAHLRENLKTPELRNEFQQANAFRRRRS